MNKIISILSSTPATIITTIIVIGLLFAFFGYFFKDFIVTFLKKKYDLLDDSEIVRLFESSNYISHQANRFDIQNEILKFKIKNK